MIEIRTGFASGEHNSVGGTVEIRSLDLGWGGYTWVCAFVRTD